MNIRILVAVLSLLVAAFRLISLIRKKLKESKREAYLQKRNAEYPIEIVSINYKGRKKHSITIAAICTEWHRDKRLALDELKEMAREVKATYIVDVEEEKDTNYEMTEGGGRHYYTVWKFHGIAAR